MNRMSENTSKITKKHKFECQGETTSVLHRKRNNSIYLKEVEQMTKIPRNLLNITSQIYKDLFKNPTLPQ